MCIGNCFVSSIASESGAPSFISSSSEVVISCFIIFRHEIIGIEHSKRLDMSSKNRDSSAVDSILFLDDFCEHDSRAMFFCRSFCVRCFFDLADSEPFSVFPFLFTPFHLYCCT